MERRKFIKTCCYSSIGLPLIGGILSSCESLYYATSTVKDRQLIVAKSEFINSKKEKHKQRTFVMLQYAASNFPICLYKIDEEKYVASLLKCTHRGCELNVGGGIYSCPCHGSEFTVTGKVIQGPAISELKTYPITTDNENIYIQLS